MIRIAQPIIGREEEAAVLSVLRSGQLAQGKTVAEFESAVAAYLGVRHAIAVSSGTAALVIAVQAHGIGQGDDIIVPVFTFAATANAVLLAGARPVFVDIEPATYNIDATKLELALTPRTKAVVPVHLFGQAANMTAISQFAMEHNLAMIEDACQAFGARWHEQKAGAFGTACLSFYATKGITSGEGGMIMTDDADLAEKARLLRNQGESVRYRTDLLGQNYRMTEVAAALGLAQLKHVDEWIERRRTNTAWLNRYLEGVETPNEHPAAHHTYQQYTVGVSDGRRNALQASLLEQDIESAVYYPLCLHQQPLYIERGLVGNYPVAEAAATEVLSLPVHAALSQEDLERIAFAVNLTSSAVAHGG